MISKRYLIWKKHGEEEWNNEIAYVDAEDIPLMKDIFRGVKHCRLPIVYVSKTFVGKAPLDVSFLASRLKGAAHVLVADSAATGRLFRKECSER